MALSCTDLMNEAAAQYEGVELETRAGKTVTLRNLLMLSEDGLKTARVLLGEFAKNGENKDADSFENIEAMVPRLRDLLLLVADDTAALKKEMQDWPLSMYLRAVDAWQETTQVGEAKGSDS